MPLRQNRFVRKLALGLLSLVSGLNRIVPKSERKIVFWDSTGQTFQDNTRALLEHVCRNGYGETHQLFCSSPSPKKFAYLEKQFPVRVCGMLGGLWAFLTSKYCFYSFGSMRITPSPRQVVVNQWHGTPLKTIGAYNQDDFTSGEKIDCFTYLLAASEQFRPIMAKAFQCDESRVKVIGHSRNDYLFSDVSVLERFHIHRANYRKLILWMPTFRVSRDARYRDCGASYSLGETQLPLVDTFDQLEALNVWLAERDILLCLKIHLFSVFTSFNYSNIKLFTSKDFEEGGVHLYSFVKDFDALLTDYSSIFFDYLLLDRPIGFIVDDISIYESNRGFILNPVRSYLPGPQIETLDGLYQFFIDVSQERDLYASDRARVRAFSNAQLGNQNCSDLLSAVGLIK